MDLLYSSTMQLQMFRLYNYLHTYDTFSRGAFDHLL